MPVIIGATGIDKKIYLETIPGKQNCLQKKNSCIIRGTASNNESAAI
jgi:hypothetical protein